MTMSVLKLRQASVSGREWDWGLDVGGIYVSIIGQPDEEFFSLPMVFFLTVVRKFRSRISFGAVQNQPAQTAEWRNRFGL
jgi:hypothetical protein